MFSAFYHVQKTFLTYSGKSFLRLSPLFILFVDVSSVQVHGKINQQVKFASDHHLAPLSALFSPLHLFPGAPFYPLTGCRAASGLKEQEFLEIAFVSFSLLLLPLPKIITNVINIKYFLDTYSSGILLLVFIYLIFQTSLWSQYFVTTIFTGEEASPIETRQLS